MIISREASDRKHDLRMSEKDELPDTQKKKKNSQPFLFTPSYRKDSFSWPGKKVTNHEILVDL